VNVWRARFQRLDDKCRFSDAASDEEIEAVQKALGIALPDELVALLSETDGVADKHGGWFIWSCKQIRDDNLRFRSHPDFRELYMPFDSLVFFGDAGNGDQFAFPVCGQTIPRRDVFAWNHENDSRTWVAPDLEKFVEWWFKEKIKL
jgi:SMI1 / KNR4 family (SUKH-1)